MSTKKRCFCIDIENKPHTSTIKEMTMILDNAIRNESKNNHSNRFRRSSRIKRSNHLRSSEIENFDCDEICTGSKKSVFETNESKNIILLFGLIFFYYIVRH